MTTNDATYLATFLGPYSKYGRGGTPQVIFSSDTFSLYLVLALLAYTIAIDILIFVLSAWKLYFPRMRRTRLISRMLHDGIAYFLLV